MDFYGFYTGKILDAYDFLGCHIKDEGVVFRTFAPGAQRITITGEFNDWTETEMYKIYDGNFWECFIENAKENEMYKYRIYIKNNKMVEHCDPYGFGMELRPGAASIIRNISNYTFNDNKWLKKRNNLLDKPLNIYELHLGSWKKKEDTETGWYTYREITELLIPYVKKYNYNYIEIMPIGEHPIDKSWGYQQTGFYSATSRYGTMDDLKYLIDMCHQNGIGVLLDFVPVHFAVDAYGLSEFDGTSLYEYPNIDVGYSEWGSKNFMHSRGEVQSFLQSCANYWIKEYHFDGLRIDALSNMIYWQGDKKRGVNQNAVRFIQHMNKELKRLNPGIMLIAEDSTDYPNVTKSVKENGLGFDYKWNMGWMNDTLTYFKLSTKDRIKNYHKLTFSMMYYYNENYLLPLSHDEVVHGKATIVQKMNGLYEDKFHQARAFYMYMYAHPGKKLNFMGNEIGQLREWDEKREQDWDILKYPIHDSFSKFMKELSRIYLKNSALFEMDYSNNGFEWINCNLEEKCIYSFKRISKKQTIIAVFNFSNKKQLYKIPINKGISLKLLISSNDPQYGGSNTSYTESKNNIFKIELEPFTAEYYIEIKS